MKKEIIIMALIILFVIILNSVTQSYTKSSVNSMVNKLEIVKENLNSENKEIIGEKINRTKDTWNERKQILSYYLEHNELEKIEVEIEAINADNISEDYDALSENLERCIFLLEHIRDKETVKLGNIF